MNQYIIAVALIVWGASLFGVGLWQRHDGESAANLSWEARYNTEVSQAAQQIKTAEDAVRKAEQAHAAKLSYISATYQKELVDAKAQHARDLAAIRAGTIRLRDPAYTAPVPACPGAAPQTAATAGGCDGGKTGEFPGSSAGFLSGGASEFLIGLANDADDVARQLAACQRVVTEDRQ